MTRTGLGRGPVAAVALLFCLFGFGVSNAYATHYRYANVYWERVLTHPVVGEYKYRVTIEGGYRWSFPWGFNGINNCRAEQAVLKIMSL